MEEFKCACKTVSLLFSCGHEFKRTSSCNDPHNSHNPTIHDRNEIVFRSHEKCMECETAMTACGRPKEETENAVTSLGENGNADRSDELFGFYEEDGRLGYDFGYEEGDGYNIGHEIWHDDGEWTDCDLYGQTSESIQRATEEQSRVTSCAEQEDEISGVTRHSTELVTEWLAVEATDTTHIPNTHHKAHVLIFPVGPLRDVDDPYDTSASSCGRTSNGTIKQYIPGVDRKPINTVRTRQVGPIITRPELIQPIDSKQIYRNTHSSHPRPYTWPHHRTVHTTTASPPVHRIVTSAAPKRSLTKKFRTSILESYETVFNKVFTKKGIDGRTLQRRRLTLTAEPRVGRKLLRRGSRAERKADDLRSRMLRKTYDAPGFFEIVVSESCGLFADSEDNTVEDDVMCKRRV